MPMATWGPDCRVNISSHSNNGCCSASEGRSSPWSTLTIAGAWGIGIAMFIAWLGEKYIKNEGNIHEKESQGIIK